MPVATETIACNFVGQFKVGDNLVFNVGLLEALMAADEDGGLNKPIVIQAAAVVDSSSKSYERVDSTPAIITQCRSRGAHYVLARPTSSDTSTAAT